MAEPENSRIIKAVHGVKVAKPDPEFEIGLAAYIRSIYDPKAISEFYGQYSEGDEGFSAMMRRVIWRAAARGFGNGITVGSGVGFKHLETFDLGDGVFIGSQSYIQGRFDGRCKIGNFVWIGPQSYFDARDLIIEDYVGWGPGAKVLGSAHTGDPIDVPVIQTDLEVKTVKIGAWADIGVNAVILPGITIGKGCIVGAGSVVTHDVPDFAVVAGSPARFLHWRKGYEPPEGGFTG
jgi:acetyltransferase-like isoleucine patch superfamily enzyme